MRPAGHGVQTGIHHCDLPRLGVVIMYGHFILAVGKIKGNVTGVQEVIRDHSLIMCCLYPAHTMNSLKP